MFIFDVSPITAWNCTATDPKIHYYMLAIFGCNTPVTCVAVPVPVE